MSGSCWSNCTGTTRHEEHHQKCSIAVIVALGISLAPGSVRTSKEGQQKIAGWEDCRSTPYYCTAGVLTVGIGSTGGVENREYSNQK